MNALHRVLALIRKDLAVGPRSPILLYALALPILITVLLQGVFGDLFDRAPRLGIVAAEGAVWRAAEALEGIRVVRLPDEAELRRALSTFDLDAGLLLPPDFAAALRAGDRPQATFFAAGESAAATRAVAFAAATRLARSLDAKAPPVDVTVIAGGQSAPLVERLAPFAVLLALFAAGVLVPAFSVVEERDRRTLDGLLSSPMSFGEILWAKGLLGGVLAGALAAATLLLNGWGNVTWALVVALALAATAAALLGLIYGVVAPNAAGLFALFKTFNVLVFAPVFFYVFPDWPRAIAYALPTFWIIDPIVAIAERGATFAEVAPSFLPAVAACAVAGVVLRRLAYRALVASPG